MPERHIGKYLGRFRIDALIGSGGFAWVYKGYDPQLEIPVAIKVLKPQFAGEEAFEQRFRLEASTAAKLRHPNIVRILAVGREDQAVYFVMDYLPTGLDDRLRIMGTLPETLLIRLGLDVSAALAFAHREGVIHRDIKTDNILFDEHGNAIVADFGIARAVSGYTARTGTNMVVGTPQYFSPEQARGQALDGRADIYSLGVTLFRAATGVLPFQGEDWYDIARQHVEEPPPKPRALNPALTRGAERIILKCLEKDPAERYPTADALHTELVQLFGQTVSPSGEATAVLPTPVTGSDAQAGATTPVAGRRLSGRARGIAVAASLVAVVLVAAQVRERGHAAATQPDSLAQTEATLAEPGTRPDSSPAVVLAAEPAPAPKPELRVIAPASAEVRLDGRRVGRGAWRGRDLAPGEHRVSAMVRTIPGCPSAREDATVRLGESGPTEVTLSPRPCGTVTLDIIQEGVQEGAQWWLTAVPSGAEAASGRAPVSAPVVLPEGTYTLRVEARFCAPYGAPVRIVADTTQYHRVRMWCGSTSSGQ